MLGDVLNWQGIFFIACWLLIIVRGVQLGSVRLYSVFYGYVAVQTLALLSSLMGGFVWGLADERYLQLYMLNSIATQLATALLLVWLLTFPRAFRPHRDLLILALFLLISAILEVTLSTGGHFIWRTVRGGSFFLLFLAAYVVLRCSLATKFRMGWNMGAVLAGMTFLLAMQGINTTFFLTSQWAYENFRNLYEAVGICTWGAIAWAMLDLDPPERESINREVSTLRRMLNLGKKVGKIAATPYFPLVREQNVRQGWFHQRDYRRLKMALPPYLRPIVTMAYCTGMRKGEILGLTWGQIDFHRRLIRL